MSKKYINLTVTAEAVRQRFANALHWRARLAGVAHNLPKPVHMRSQNYRNHKRFVFLYHGLTLLAIFALLVGSVVNLLQAPRETFYTACLFVLIALILLSLYFFARYFPLKVQDRAIRAEENLRHFILCGKPLDRELTMQQIIALRFASDEEFVRLAKKAVEEALNMEEIKSEIKNWRADYCRA